MVRLDAYEQERSRLAEELHDGTAQALSNAILQTEVLERVSKTDPAGVMEEISRLRQLLKRELESLRAYISQLRPPMSEPEAVDQALEEAAGNMTEYTGIPVDMRLEASGAVLGPAARNVALRVAQEALRNVGKHSKAERAWIATRLERDGQGDVWVLEIGDDGRGFEYAAPLPRERRRHFGLRFMRERSDLLGAELKIESKPTAGTVVRLCIRLERERS